ncbi:hypothetical protein TheetDRAFT_1313 [Thermoanaerobacter ethanolicus JW 200]|jgi:hypothetical protein|uniref:glycerol dehydratase reactivase beta/small subunit family protein n=1 Tax=Thermoanaerobacter TaxID=1754 RepID=UPI0000E1DE5D|nr:MULTISPECIES: glycerol dehydratase reactivase beta/small subunit family protein [unclassified Thermoanaerobacter]ABY93227.1 hypothetical protein Teth514_1949 [Thermoanaerobacter sp. X514]EGD51921.1 hypothetical protein TheetDRAFT_1313 [Thermoanaerobacter ethanolicus JW 200]
MSKDEIKKPVVLIYCDTIEGTNIYLKKICEGLEEEGVPFQIQQVEKVEDSVEVLAQNASRNSNLGIGIGVLKNGDCALLQRRLPPNLPIQTLRGEKYDPNLYRNIGINAARLAKNLPLVFA